MKKSGKILAGAIALLLVGYGGFRVYQVIEERTALSTATSDDQPLPRVAVQKVQRKTLSKTVQITGQAEALARVDVISKVTGRLERLRLPSGEFIEEGVRVEKGQVIAMIERSALQAAVKRARAAVEVAKASLRQAKVNLEDSRREKERWLALYEKDSASEQKKDRAVMVFQLAQAGLSLAESQVAQTRAALLQSEVTLGEATIKAPISGVISKKFVDEGNMAGPGSPLVRIVQMETVKVTGDLSERYLSSVAAGKTIVQVTTDAHPGSMISGTVFMVGVEVNPRTRTVQVETRLPNPDHRLKPGMFAHMTLILEKRENVPVVPEAALIRRGPDTYAYAVNSSSVHYRQLTLGICEGDFCEIVKGLQPGELVVIRGKKMIQNGDEVKIIEGVRP
ncbi:MAG: efflux RND transporter periplasmic adaptor subunit [Thermodesulfobacteriota bacterium]|nr:efflux RND transporter periplasmic adaptor subunit [Thermodesulfobacteriota bacterium]